MPLHALVHLVAEMLFDFFLDAVSLHVFLQVVLKLGAEFLAAGTCTGFDFDSRALGLAGEALFGAFRLLRGDRDFAGAPATQFVVADDLNLDGLPFLRRFFLPADLLQKHFNLAGQLRLCGTLLRRPRLLRRGNLRLISLADDPPDKRKGRDDQKDDPTVIKTRSQCQNGLER